MPCLEISLPRIELPTKQRLAAALTRTFAETTGHAADIFGVRFFEYGPGEAAHGGRLWDCAGDPYLHMLLYSPRLRRTVKQAVVERLSAAFREHVGHPDWVPVIHIAEHPYDNVGVDGRLLSDRFPECAERAFYYPLPTD